MAGVEPIPVGASRALTVSKKDSVTAGLSLMKTGQFHRLRVGQV
jgi:hypothetical protein